MRETRISDDALARYEAEYERVLFMEKAYEMWGSEHEKAARRSMLEMAVADGWNDAIAALHRNLEKVKPAALVVSPEAGAITVDEYTLDTARMVDSAERERRVYCNGRAATTTEVLLARALLKAYGCSPHQEQRP